MNINNLRTRDYQPSDFEQIANLWIETGLGNPQRGDNHDVIETTINCGGKFIVLENKETKQILGTSWITNDGRRLYVHHCGIKPEFQGKGLANLLVEATLKYVKEKNLQVKLEVHKDNAKAIKLYKKYGFTYLGDYHVYIIRDVQNI